MLLVFFIYLRGGSPLFLDTCLLESDSLKSLVMAAVHRAN